MNKVILEGFLGADPIVRYAQSGTAVANLSVATHERRGKTDFTEWHRVVVFGKVAEAAAKFYAKGKQVLIEGRLQTRKWTDKNKVDRYTTEILASYARLLGKSDQPSDDTPPDEAYAAVIAQAEEKAQPKGNPPPQTYRPPVLVDDTFNEDDIPF